MAEMKWRDYYEQLLVNKAIDINNDLSTQVNYGEKIYSSAVMSKKQFDGNLMHFRWVVYKYNKEYLVFYEESKNLSSSANFTRKLVREFSWEKGAMSFALEMLLVSCGKLQRGGVLLS
ncbi:MAG: hypothetical protein KC414_12515 [Romboutsia sp.]|nr:hypothetical protein [Romboutsia sp.]